MNGESSLVAFGEVLVVYNKMKLNKVTWLIRLPVGPSSGVLSRIVMGTGDDTAAWLRRTP